MADRVRLELGFEGGQTVGISVESSAADGLEQALGGNPLGTFAIDTEDGRYVVALQKVVYLKRFAREGRVGFGAA
jgi:hypothetical protein